MRLQNNSVAKCTVEWSSLFIPKYKCVCIGMICILNNFGSHRNKQFLLLSITCITDISKEYFQNCSTEMSGNHLVSFIGCLGLESVIRGVLC